MKGPYGTVSATTTPLSPCVPSRRAVRMALLRRLMSCHCLKVSLVGCLNALYLLPLYRSAPNNAVLDPFDRWTFAHLPPHGPRMWGTLVGAYVVFGFALWLLNREFRWYITYRHAFLSRPVAENYSVVVSRIPANMRSALAVHKFFRCGTVVVPEDWCSEGGERTGQSGDPVHCTGRCMDRPLIGTPAPQGVPHAEPRQTSPAAMHTIAWGRTRSNGPVAVPMLRTGGYLVEGPRSGPPSLFGGLGGAGAPGRWPADLPLGCQPRRWPATCFVVASAALLHHRQTTVGEAPTAGA